MHYNRVEGARVRTFGAPVSFSPLIKPDVRISSIRLSDRFYREGPTASV